MNLATPLGIWQAGILVGLHSVLREPSLGCKRLVLPVSYWRAAEFSFVWRELNQPAGSRVLDLGSPKDLAYMLARHRGYHVVATDILPATIALSRRYAVAQGIEGRAGGEVWSELQDGRALSFPDNSFDAAYSVSVLEHIPGDGDSIAMGELLRVVRPGGLVIVTVPYAEMYRETFVDGPVYERRPVSSERVFFERHYDDGTLAQRLLLATAKRESFELWGEGRLRIERLLCRLGPLRLPLSPVEAFLSAAGLRKIEKGDEGHPMAAFFVLRKPVSTSA